LKIAQIAFVGVEATLSVKGSIERKKRKFNLAFESNLFWEK
jgi:hypothetical protein